MEEFIGQELFVTPWFTVAESDQLAFMNSTGLTPDVIRLGQPNSMVHEGIVEGFFLLSLLPGFHFLHSPLNSGQGWGLNYGVDRARFIRLSFLADEFRMRSELTSVDVRKDGKVAHLRNTFEVKRGQGPVAIANWLSFYATAPEARARLVSQRPSA